MFWLSESSEAVVLVLYLFCVALWLILQSALCFKVLPCSCFFVPFSIVITSLGDEADGLCASCAFVCLFLHVLVFVLSLPLGVGVWLRFVIVALPGLFYQLS